MAISKNEWRVGLVDDDALTLAALRSLIDARLSTDGISVAWAVRSGDKAVDMCVDRGARPDAVLVDMSMDEVDGAMTLCCIRHFSDRIVLLAMTSHSLNRYRNQARFNGAQALLDKADFAGLTRCLRDCAAGRPYVQDGFPAPSHGIPITDGPTLATGRATHIDAERHGMVPLSARETEVMDWTIEGLTAKEVAEKMALSEPTVKTHIRHAIAKLQVRNKFQAIRVWSEMRRNG